MIFDLQSVTPDERHRGYDVCIAGGGVAGITLARDLANRGQRVLLLEAGGLDISSESQDSYIGESVGRPYFPLEIARLRYLGGTSNHWHGWCRPLEAADFERHDHIPDSGWPIAKSELDTYLEPAAKILDLTPVTRPDYVLDNSGNSFSVIEFRKSSGPVRFGTAFLSFLETSDRIDLFINANLVDARMNGRRVTNFLCANYKEPRHRYSFTARNFVFSMGGIENARMLLNFATQNPAGIGNDQDLVGRYFMDHYHLTAGLYIANPDVWPFLTDHARAFLATTPALSEREKIGNCQIQLRPMYIPQTMHDKLRQSVCSDDVLRDFVKKFYTLQCPVNVYCGGVLEMVSEQMPNRNSRVRLSDDTDAFGLRRTALDWEMADMDRKTMTKTITRFGTYLAQKGYGNIKMIDWLWKPDVPVPAVGEDDWLGAGWHHMGTTRMANNPTEGVVDENCRVFGIDNLFMAGSSVFPTVGHANPTFTIVQLTLRLGNHLANLG